MGEFKIKCLKCNDVIESMFRHDFRYCGCGNAHVDGGNDYMKYGALEAGTIAILQKKKPIILVRTEGDAEACSKCHFWNIEEDDCNFSRYKCRIISGNTECSGGGKLYYFKLKDQRKVER